jgi:competence protein ComEC
MGGILVASYCPPVAALLAGSLLGLCLLGYVLIVVATPVAKFRSWSPVLGLLALCAIFLVGYLRCATNKVANDPNHLTHWAEHIEAYEAIALENAHTKSTRNNVLVGVQRARIQGQWKQVRGRVRLSFPEPTPLQVGYGDLLLIHGQPQVVPAPKNPNEFDYAAFLALSQIAHQQFVMEEEVVVTGYRPPNVIKRWSFQTLRYFQALLTQRIHHPEVRSVVIALVLGQKDALTSEVKTAYTNAGTMHVLAVSGLHVGILYGLLQLFLGLLKGLRGIRWVSPIISLAALWFYAFVTGLSPSVLRATLMFTVVALAGILNRKTNLYNTLAASAFLLLFWNPMLLFAVGFQLSYLAVVGIVYLQPKIYHALTFRNWLFDKLWMLSSLSLGAQLATMPLVLYYFHQFPTYFLVANWVVVPAVSVMLCLALGVLMTSFWAPLSTLIADMLEKVVLAINGFVGIIQRLPYGLVDHIHVDAAVVLLLYLILLLCLALLHTRQMKYLLTASMLVIMLSLHAIQVHWGRQGQRKLIFYSVNHHQVISFVKGQHSTLCVDNRFSVDSPKYAYHVQPNQTALGITSLVTYTLEEATEKSSFPLQTVLGLKVAVWQGKKLLIINDSIRDLPRLAEKIYVDFLVVEGNAVKTLQPLLDRFYFGTLIIGTCNQQALAQQLQEEATQHGLCSHSLFHQGAFTAAW